jgi:hypothetical protein
MREGGFSLTVDRPLRHCDDVTLPCNTVVTGPPSEGLPSAVVSDGKRWARGGIRIARWLPLAIWFAGVTVLMSALAFSHWFSLPHPGKRDTRLAAGISELLRDSRGWAAIHVLYTDCQCSQRIIDHLVESDRPAGLHEVVVLVGSNAEMERRLRTKGYAIVAVEPEVLYKRFGIEGAPLFVFVDSEHVVRYIGGYTERQQGPDIRDLFIMRDVRAGVAISDLPLFGCAVSQRLKELADPLAIKR